MKTINTKNLGNGEINPIDEYIASQPLEAQPFLNQVRNAISSALPNALEIISYQIPTYYKNKNIIHFGAFKNHIGIYPGPKAIEHFKNKLNDFKHSKGTIQIPYNQSLPLDLIKEIAIWCEKSEQ